MKMKQITKQLFDVSKGYKKYMPEDKVSFSLAYIYEQFLILLGNQESILLIGCNYWTFLENSFKYE